MELWNEVRCFSKAEESALASSSRSVCVCVSDYVIMIWNPPLLLRKLAELMEERAFEADLNLTVVCVLMVVVVCVIGSGGVC